MYASILYTSKSGKPARSSADSANFAMQCFVSSLPLTKSPAPLVVSSTSRLSTVQILHPTKRRAAQFTMTVSASSLTATKPPQVVLTPLPRLYQYDHCPYCVRVRYCLGVKNVKHELIWLLNDDVATPTALVGKKMVPIFAPQGATGPAIPESLDICAAVDSDPRYGATGAFRAASGRKDFAALFSDNATLIRRLTRPRISRAYLAEFATQDARDAFIRNHALPEPSDYDENLTMTPQLVADLQPKLAALDSLIYSKEFCTEGGLSFDDIDLFPRLRTLTMVKDLVLPPKAREYVEYHSALSDVGNYFALAT